MNLVQQAFSHSVPFWLQRFPSCLRWVHRTQSLLYSRNRIIKSAVRQHAQSFEGVLLDVGCGDGHYSLQAINAGVKHVVGVDKNDDWMTFLRGYFTLVRPENEKTICFETVDLDEGFLPNQREVDLIFCFSVLPYLNNPRNLIKQLSDKTKPGGTLLLYTPVAFDTVLPPYRWMFERLRHYESVQNRKALMSAEEIFEQTKKVGYQLKSYNFTYGFWGKLGHECWSMSLMLLGDRRLILQSMGILSALITIPVNLICGFIDRRIPLKHGNGLMAEFQKD